MSINPSPVYKPITIGSVEAQQCIVQQYCIDSNGVTYPNVLIDSCHGNMMCEWQVSCDDMKSYCLPAVYVSSPMYLDEFCQVPFVSIILSESDAGLVSPNFIVISYYPIDTDAAPKQVSCVKTYAIEAQIDSIQNAYYLSYIDTSIIKEWQCNTTQVHHLQTSGFFLIDTSGVDASANFVSEY